MVGLCRPRQADGGKSRHEIITKQDTNAMLRIFVFVLRGGLDGKSICLQFRRPGFTGGAIVKTPCFQCQGQAFNP